MPYKKDNPTLSEITDDMTLAEKRRIWAKNARETRVIRERAARELVLLEKQNKREEKRAETDELLDRVLLERQKIRKNTKTAKKKKTKAPPPESEEEEEVDSESSESEEELVIKSSKRSKKSKRGRKAAPVKSTPPEISRVEELEKQLAALKLMREKTEPKSPVQKERPVIVNIHNSEPQKKPSESSEFSFLKF